jgi:hypothetical protein
MKIQHAMINLEVLVMNCRLIIDHGQLRIEYFAYSTVTLLARFLG